MVTGREQFPHIIVTELSSKRVRRVVKIVGAIGDARAATIKEVWNRLMLEHPYPSFDKQIIYADDIASHEDDRRDGCHVGIGECEVETVTV